MKKRAVILVVMLFLLVSTAFAKQVQVSTAAENQIEIIYPKNDYYAYGQDFSLHFHAHNSTGFILTNETTNCTIQIHNETGTHLYDEALLFESSNYFYLDVDGSKFSHVGEYGYLVDCKNELEAGYVSTTFLIAYGSPIGEAVAGWLLAAIILVPILFGLLIVAGSTLLDPEEHMVLRIIMFLFAFVSFFMSLLLGLISVARYLDYEPMQDNITTLLWVVGVMFFVVLSYFMIFAFYKAVKKAAQDKKEMMGI